MTREQQAALRYFELCAAERLRRALFRADALLLMHRQNPPLQSGGASK